VGDEPDPRPPGAAADDHVVIEGLTRRFGAVTAVDALDLRIRRGEIFALLGPSGCGKSTLLRMLAGLETVDAGRVLLDGEDVTAMAPHRRPVNMMFQSYALFPHLSVADNIAFGLKRLGMPKPERDARVAEMLALARLEQHGRRRPHQLSGGQRQRVALARALARKPRLLLLDEPLAALDRQLREQTRTELAAILEAAHVTCVMVTHDQDEALSLAHRIAVMDTGRIAQLGTPDDVYRRPDSRYVAGFIGTVNLFDAVPHEGALRCDALGLEVPAPEGATARAALALRPEDLFPLEADASAEGRIAVRIERRDFLGATQLLHGVVDGGGPRVRIQADVDQRPEAGDVLTFGFHRRDLVALAQ
jgi:ABC-type Fe3+/spermidine/putrescine transport system ATPase subunit